MHREPISPTTNYDPDNLLDVLREMLQLKNDVELSRVLGVAPPHISSIRHRRLAIGARLLIRMHEVSGINIRDLRVLMGDRRAIFCDPEDSPRVAQFDHQSPAY